MQRKALCFDRNHIKLLRFIYYFKEN